MKYRAMIKQSDGWWIGWLMDLPGVNAQERTRQAVIESLKIGARDMLATQVPFEPDSTMIIIDVPNPHRGTIGVDLLQRILRRARVSREEWPGE